MFKKLKDIAMKRASQLLGGGGAAGLLAHPKLQDVMRRVVNLRADVRDALDDRVATIARRFDLVTQKELRDAKRVARELENQVASLEHELSQQRRRADRAEAELEQARKDEAAADKKRAAKRADDVAQLPLAPPEPEIATEAGADALEIDASAKAEDAEDAPPAKAASKKAPAKKAPAKKAAKKSEG